ncbi:MAG: hypothetical protein KHY10_07995 [Gemella haemolysans]|nr:hypothetical protein [Gemella haemolysans]MBS5319612.1 hypothetical protein [Gemella haemolysans]
MTTKTLVATAGVDLDISRNEETTKYLQWLLAKYFTKSVKSYLDAVVY